MTRSERITASDLRHEAPRRSPRKHAGRRLRTSDRQDPCGSCGKPWAIGFDHRECKDK